MTEKLFVFYCKKEIIEYTLKQYNVHITEADVFVVWQCKALQNFKALLTTSIEDNMYYEITYNGNTQELYVDAYKKVTNYTVVV
jgi:hypothetical protein